MRVQENFYEREEIQLLESMENGILYSNILMKLYLKSIKREGKLMFNDLIPYTPEILAKILKVEIGTMTFALNTFKHLGLIEVLDNGAIFMSNIQDFIGKTSTEADRKRAYRNRIEDEKRQLSGQISDKCPDISTPEIEKEKELKLEKDTDKELNKEKEKDKETITMVLNAYAPNGSELRNALNEFKEMRSKMKKPLTVRALKQALNQLDKLSGCDEMTKIAIVDQTLSRGWLSFYELKIDTNKSPTTSSEQNNKVDAFEALLQRGPRNK